MKNILLIAIFSLLLLTGCKKKEETQDVPQMPPYTETDANTAAYKVDGEIVIPATEGLFSNPPIFKNVIIAKHYLSLELFKQLNNQNERVLIIDILNFYRVENYILNGTFPDQIKNCGYFNNETGVYDTDSLHTGNVSITKFDTIKKIISGRFAFKAYNFNTNKVVNITEGQVDITY